MRLSPRVHSFSHEVELSQSSRDTVDLTIRQASHVSADLQSEQLIVMSAKRHFPVRQLLDGLATSEQGCLRRILVYSRPVEAAKR